MSDSLPEWQLSAELHDSKCERDMKGQFFFTKKYISKGDEDKSESFFFSSTRIQGCHIYLGTTYQIGEKYTKWS
jgi:hypothetical protein